MASKSTIYLKENKKARLTLLLDEALKARFMSICKTKEIEGSKILREFIKYYVNKNGQTTISDFLK